MFPICQFKSGKEDNASRGKWVQILSSCVYEEIKTNIKKLHCEKALMHLQCRVTQVQTLVSFCRWLLWKLVKPLATGSHRCDGGRQSHKRHTTLPKPITTDGSVRIHTRHTEGRGWMHQYKSFYRLFFVHMNNTFWLYIFIQMTLYFVSP